MTAFFDTGKKRILIASAINLMGPSTEDKRMQILGTIPKLRDREVRRNNKKVKVREKEGPPEQGSYLSHCCRESLIYTRAKYVVRFSRI